MKKEQVKIGQLYAVKVTDKVVPVRIDAEHKDGGWEGANMQTNRKVRIKSAQKLRSRIAPGKADDHDQAAAENEQPKPAKKKATSTKSKSDAAPKDKKLSLLDAAVQVLGEATEPMNTKHMVDAVAEQGLWSPGSGKTPHATLYSAILRELQNKGDDARFVKVDRGQFTLAPGMKKGA